MIDAKYFLVMIPLLLIALVSVACSNVSSENCKLQSPHGAGNEFDLPRIALNEGLTRKDNPDAAVPKTSKNPWNVEYEILIDRPGRVAQGVYGGNRKYYFRFTEHDDVNSLLLDVEGLEAAGSSIEVVFTNANTALLPDKSREVDFDWSFIVFDKNMFNDNPPHWHVRVEISESSFDLKDLEIPLKLKVEYKSRLTYFLQHHNQRRRAFNGKNEDPTTSEMVWGNKIRFESRETPKQDKD